MQLSGQQWKHKYSEIEFGERYRETRDVHNTSTSEDLIHEKGFYDNGIFWLKYRSLYFIENNRIFLLAYEPLSGEEKGTKYPGRHNVGTPIPFEREVFLYSKDLSMPISDWEVASVSVFEGRMTSSAVLVCSWQNSDNYNWVDLFPYDKERHNTSIGSVKKSDYGKVEITFGVRGLEYGRSFFDKITLVFEPVDSTHYTFKRQ